MPNLEEHSTYLKSILEKIRSRLLDKICRNRQLNYKEDVLLLD